MTIGTSTWLIRENSSMDANSPTSLNAQNAEIGVLTVGGSKTKRTRWIAKLDLFSETPKVGRVLTPSDVVLTAELWGGVPIVTGTTGFQCDIHRIVRSDYDYLNASWNNYKAASAWATAGADNNGADHVTPPVYTFNSPTATGYQKITDQLVAITNDAITSRSGLLIMRIKANGEGATDHYFVVKSDPDNEAADPEQARIIVTYEEPEPTKPRQVPGGKGLVMRPLFDHILNVRPSGERIREIEHIGEGLRRVTRNRLGDRHAIFNQHRAATFGQHPACARHRGRRACGVPGDELRARAGRAAAGGGRPRAAHRAAQGRQGREGRGLDRWGADREGG